MTNSRKIRQQLLNLKNPDKAKLLMRFFKTGEGQYGEGDRFLGLKVPQVRTIVCKFQSDIKISDAVILMSDPYHEVRLAGILLLVSMYEHAIDTDNRKQIAEIYLANKQYINNWDLVDLSAHKILGREYFHKDTSVLDKLVRSNNVWDRRIAVLATFWFIHERDFRKSLEYAEILLDDKQDLMHKAAGWMLREIGKRDKKTLTDFLDIHASRLPRTMLRYAIEKFPEAERQRYLKTKVIRQII